MSFIACPTLTKQQTIFNNVLGRGWYHENIQHRPTLLITVGDSWTWGDSLGSINTDLCISDCKSRTTNIYGQLLANTIESDFVNVAVCGGSNLSINDKLLMVLRKMVLEYKQIYIVWTLTEICREIKDCPWRSKFKNLHKSGAIKNFDDFLEFHERHTFKEIEIVKKLYPQVKLLIARNFTYTFESNLDILNSSIAVEKTWVDVLAECQQLLNYPSDLRLMTGIAIDPLIEFLKQQQLFDNYKADLVEHYDLATKAMTWLENSDLNYKKATKHPTEQGHQAWAEYLVTYF